MGEIQRVNKGKLLKDAAHRYWIITIVCQYGTQAHPGGLWVVKENRPMVM